MSEMEIHGSQQTIGEVFSGGLAYEIPHYQRPYSWTVEETGTLLNDLLDALGAGGTPVDGTAPYFLGCIVLIQQKKSPVAQVVDGQQRLTTIAVLLAVLRECLTDKGRAEGMREFLYTNGNPNLGTENRYRLLVRDTDRVFFKEHVQESGGLAKLVKIDGRRLSTVSQQNLQATGALLMERVGKLEEEVRQRLASFLLSRCVLVVVSSPDLDSAYRIFSVMNNRGLDLSHSDILKAEILGKLSPGVSEAYARKWEEWENTLGVDAFKDLFTHIRMIYCRQKARETVLKEFQEYVIKKHSAQELIDGVIVPFAEAYQDIKEASYPSLRRAEEVNELFRWLNQIDNFDWMPPAIQYLKEHRDEPEALAQFLKDLERLAAHMMICRVDITTRIKRYGELLSAMANKADLSSPTSPLQLSGEECAAATKALDGDLYHIRNVPKYVLLRLDALLSGGEAKYDHNVVSIEHVLPQQPAADSDWCRNFPDEVAREATVHRLGNLVLLSHRKNSSAQNHDFDMKKDKYFRSNGKVSAFALTTQVLNEKAWTPAVVERRQKELLGRLKLLWRL